MPRRLPFAPVETVSYRQLLPSGGDTDADTFVNALRLSHADPEAARPYTVVNFVASLDGRTTIDGRSRKLGDAGDRELFRALRERSDAVLVGTGTLATETYGRILLQPERRERRLSAGRPAEPLVATITRTANLPLEIPLFGHPEARIVVFSPTPPDTIDLSATVIHEPLDDLASALKTLRERHGVRTLLCEGGPQLFGALLRERLVDELFLTLAPKLVGGASGPAVVSGPPPEVPVEVTLASALERDGSLFLRYKLGD
jgi:riboflavin biosynthesis pyrimidine reductase